MKQGERKAIALGDDAAVRYESSNKDAVPVPRLFPFQNCAVFIYHPGELAQFVIAEAPGLRNSDRVKPELRVPPTFLNVDMTWLMPLQREEEESASSDSQYCGRSGILFPGRRRVNLFLYRAAIQTVERWLG